MIYIDAHVHIHRDVNIGMLLTSAVQNFHQAEKSLNGSVNQSSQYVLCLTEIQDVQKFQELKSRSKAAETERCHWQFRETRESDSLVAVHPDVGELIIIAGRQIVTSERLEVLALGTDKSIPDGNPITDVINRVQELDALAVVPWGFGKWIGKRGAVLDRVLRESFRQPIFLGDNSGRPKHWRRPPHFVEARNYGMRVLPGSDPLPFPSEFERIGSFGFVMEDSVSNINAAADLKRLLLDKKGIVRTYGHLESPIRFLRNQIAMQYRIRKGLR